MSIESLPPELLQQIFSNCCTMDLKEVSGVCHRWNDAVQSLLLKRVCLTVSMRKLFKYHYMYHCKAEEALQKTNRKYTGLCVEWFREEKLPSYATSEWGQQMREIQKLVDVWQERFPVRRLYLSAPPDKTLVQFCEVREEWLQNLVELHLLFQTPNPSLGTAICELTLPTLQQLTWIEYWSTMYGGPAIPEWYYEYSGCNRGKDLNDWCSFVFNAPELRRLVVLMHPERSHNVLESSLQDPDVCSLFLPALELRSSSKLENVTIGGLLALNQRKIDNNERFFQYLKALTLVACKENVIEQICGKCLNLKELTIDEPLGASLALQISPALSPGLEKLTIKNWPRFFQLHGSAVFPKLRYICLASMSGRLPMHARENSDICIDAPQLHTIIALVNFKNMTLLRNDQVSTMTVSLIPSIMRTVSYAPNVTDLHLRFYNTECIAQYLTSFHNLRRLTLEVQEHFPAKRVNFSFVKHLSNLEYLFAHRLHLTLADFDEFSTMKSLIVSDYIITLIRHGDEVLLANLDYFRVRSTAIYNCIVDRFPIRTNERQPPIEEEATSVFSSRNFQTLLPNEFESSLELLKRKFR